MTIRKISPFNRIFEVDSFEKEFIKAVDEKLVLKEPFPRYQKWLIGKLNLIEEYGREVTQFRDFEKLNVTGYDLYAIRYPKSKKNPRVIFFFIQNNKAMLLTAFLEKSSSDYNSAILHAKNKVDEIQKLLGGQ